MLQAVSEYLLRRNEQPTAWQSVAGFFKRVGTAAWARYARMGWKSDLACVVAAPVAFAAITYPIERSFFYQPMVVAGQSNANDAMAFQVAGNILSVTPQMTSGKDPFLLKVIFTQGTARPKYALMVGHPQVTSTFGTNPKLVMDAVVVNDHAAALNMVNAEKLDVETKIASGQFAAFGDRYVPGYVSQNSFFNVTNPRKNNKGELVFTVEMDLKSKSSVPEQSWGLVTQSTLGQTGVAGKIFWAACDPMNGDNLRAKENFIGAQPLAGAFGYEMGNLPRETMFSALGRNPTAAMAGLVGFMFIAGLTTTKRLR